MHWIYLSPHFDDVALSCGGLAWEQAQAGNRLSIWTVCAGEPPDEELSPFAQELQARWGIASNAAFQRSQEDITSCLRLGATYLHLSIPDCIYRKDSATGKFMYASEMSLNGELHAGDHPTIEAVYIQLAHNLEEGAILVCPLALGKHVDHQLTRAAAEALHRPVWYYADYPYALRDQPPGEHVTPDEWTSQSFEISQEGITAWQEAVAAHASQISTFWRDIDEMKQAILDYTHQEGGVRLWRKRSE
jgi:LmbE family N-acetylglucosaminyl deacetylase